MPTPVWVAIVIASAFIALDVLSEWWKAWRRGRGDEEKRFVDRG